MRQATGKPRGHRSPRKIDVTGKLTVASVSVVTLIRTDTTLDHSQKAEKVWYRSGRKNDQGFLRGRVGESSKAGLVQWFLAAVAFAPLVGPRPP